MLLIYGNFSQANKPVYILAESFKFVRFYPLGQNDLPLEVIFLWKKCDVSRIADPELSKLRLCVYL